MLIWLDGKFVEEGQVSLLSHSLHYGGAVFEGIRFYQTSKGRAIFRLEDHLERLHFSAGVMDMQIQYSTKELAVATVNAVHQSGLPDGYVRPIVFQGDGLGLCVDNLSVHVAILVVPWKQNTKPVTLAISEIRRLHPDSTNINAKISGHYVNSYLAVAAAKKLGADDALLLDHAGNVAEASVANVFFVKGSEIWTPSRENIFAGLTRETIITLLEISGVCVKERKISVAEALECEAMFIAGTAAEVLPVAKLNDVEFKSNHQVVELCRSLYQQTVKGEVYGTPSNWLTFLEKTVRET